MAADSYLATLTYDNLKKLGIKYYYSNVKLSDEIKEKFKLETKYDNENKQQYIYIVN